MALPVIRAYTYIHDMCEYGQNIYPKNETKWHSDYGAPVLMLFLMILHVQGIRRGPDNTSDPPSDLAHQIARLILHSGFCVSDGTPDDTSDLAHQISRLILRIRSNVTDPTVR